MASKVDIAVVLALATACLLWIEQGHRVTIDEPTPSELAAASAVNVPPCADSDDVPYSRDCLAFLFGRNWRSNAQNAVASNPARATAMGPATVPAPCPDRDDVPYSASCLAYLQGATTIGMRWRINAPPMVAPDIPLPVAAVTERTGFR
jgi:hypothetical protein